MTEISDEFEGTGYYLPHHAVLKEHSMTTKLRVVFDASAKSSNGNSLNDILMTGPTIQDDLISLLLRFRLYRYVLAADIEKMYRQFLVRPEDRKFQQILWQVNGCIKTFQLNTVTFGVTSAPFLAIRCLHQLAEDEKHKFPRAAEILKRDLYVDDLITGASIIEEARKIKTELIEVLKLAKLNLRKWISNEPRIVGGKPNEQIQYINLDKGVTTKTLGISWDSIEDKISYNVNTLDENNEIRTTKRTILSEIAKIFDPLGLLGPVILLAKLFMQELWKEQVNWDESVSSNFFSRWKKFYSQLTLLNNVSFNRRVVSNSQNIELHGFCDASKVAYGACIYLKTVNEEDNESHTYIFCAKSRVAPLKKPSMDIHKLELCGAELLTKLYLQVVKAINVKIHRTVLWSDSIVTLHWIKTSPHLLKTFVANRVAFIQEQTKDCSWNYVPSEDNPADAVSRGQYPKSFLKNSLWIEGPQWLRNDETAWPKSNQAPLNELPEIKKHVCFLNIVEDWETLKRFSSFLKLKRVISYCLRFKRGNRRDTWLQPDELLKAEKCIIKWVQAREFTKDLHFLKKNGCVDDNSSLLALTPFIDHDGIIRVGGRLKHANLSFEQKHPAILPRSHFINNMIILDYHIKFYHSGVQTTLNSIRQRFWMLNGKNQIKKVVRSCVTCCRANPTTCKYLMGNLPIARVIQTKPFDNTGVDYCGPFLIKEKRERNRKKIKVYVAVFICLSIKAVHLEIVSDLTSEGFLSALRRFVYRRGRPRHMYSDNGTNFVGANKELYRLFNEQTHNEKIVKCATDEGIQWHFNPPASPHFGGQWEITVRCFKHHLKRVITDSLLTFEEFNTLVIEIEAILNSRPITTLSSDPNDPQALTPSHFLITKIPTSLPEAELTTTPDNKLSRWQLVTKIRQHFWNRWHKEYLHQLNVRRTWSKSNDPGIKVGAVVLLRDEQLPSSKWKMGTVVTTHPGSDGVVRTVSVKTISGVVKRSVKVLAPLPVE